MQCLEKLRFCYRAHVSAVWEQRLVELICPFLIFDTDCRMPAIDQIEFYADLVANAGWRAIAVKDFIEVHARIKRPCRVCAIEVENSPDIVSENDIDV